MYFCLIIVLDSGNVIHKITLHTFLCTIYRSTIYRCRYSTLPSSNFAVSSIHTQGCTDTVKKSIFQQLHIVIMLYMAMLNKDFRLSVMFAAPGVNL